MLDINTIENFILEDDKRVALSKLTPYTENYYFIQLMDDLNSQTDLKSLKKRVDDFCQNTQFNHQRRQKIKIKFLFKQLSKTETETERKELLDKINEEFFKLKFNHLKPHKMMTGETLLTDENKELKSIITEDQKKLLSNDHCVQKFYTQKNLVNFRKLNPRKLHELDLTQLDIKKDLNIIQQLLNGRIKWYLSNQIVDFMKQIADKNPKLMNNHKNKLFEQMNISQLEELIKDDYFLNDSSFFHYLFNLKYEEKPFQTREEKKERIRSIIDFFNKAPKRYRESSVIYKKSLLVLNMEDGIFDEKLFLEYLNHPHITDYQNLKKTYVNVVNKKMKQKNYQQQYQPFVEKGYLCKNIIEDYLREIFIDAKNYVKFTEFFDESYLKQIFYEVKLLKGEEIKNINTIFSDIQIKKINNRKVLKFTATKKRYAQNEKVLLKVQIKNIQSLQIRVFEINTENYYLNNINGNFSDIKIESLIPFEEYSYSYNQPAMQIHNEEFEFQSITDKRRGVYVIDLIGQEMNSKAIISKGNLTLLYDNLTGRNCVILDENDEVCNSNNTGLYIQNKFFKSDPNTGVITIPREVNDQNDKIIVVNNDFAHLCQLKLRDLDYKLEINPIYNIESLMAGNKVKIIVQTRLLTNGQMTELNYLNKAELILTTGNNAGVNQTQLFSDLKLSDEKDLEIEFIVPSKMQNININLKGEVKKGNKPCKVEASFHQEFQRPNSKSKIDLGFQKNENDEYIINLFGINGECYKNQKLNINFRNLNNSTQLSFITDSNGQVNIGKLEEVKSLTITHQNNVLKNCNFIGLKKRNYSSQMSILENELLTIPLEKENHQVLIHNLSNQHKLLNRHNDFEIKDRQLQVKLLTEGSYLLEIDEEKINIRVYKGSKKILNGINIMNDNQIIPIKNKFENITTLVNKTENEIELKLNGELKNCKVHLLAYNYDQDIRFDVESKKDNQIIYDKRRNENQYFSEGRLHDELIYVYNRKNEQNYLGNTLDKPGMILKRVKLRDTKESKEQLKKGQDFDKKIQSYQKAREMSQQCRNKMGFGRSVVKNFLLREFYQNPGKMVVNCIPENGIIKIKKKDYEKYSCVKALITSFCTPNITVDLQNVKKEVDKIDLRLKESKEKGFIYRFERCMDYLKTDKNYTIPHIDKQQVCFIENLKSLFDSIQLMNKNQDQLVEWKFLHEWSTLTAEQKLKNYDKYYSHELNLFLKLKDNEFFEGVVKPFLINKKEKTLIDYYLLDNSEMMKKNLQFSNFSKLNPLEIVLSIHSLKDSQIAKSLLSFLEMKSSLVKIPIELKRKRFDTLLSSQKQQDIQGIENEVEMIVPQFSNQQFGAMNYAPAPPRGLRYGNARVQNRMMLPIQGQQNQMNLNSMNFAVQEQQQVEIFTPLQGTVEYEERNYYFKDQKSIVYDQYWYDLGKYLFENGSNKNFFSENFINVCQNPSEALSILSFTDLVFTKETFTSELKDNNLHLVPKTSLVVLTKEIIQNKGDKGDIEVMVGQRFFDPNDKYRIDDQNNTQYEKPVQEFIKGIIYESNVVVTNSTSTTLKLNVISQIPSGSIPFYSLESMNVKDLTLKALESNSFSFFFYFPQDGNYTIYPATVINNNQILSTSVIKENIEVKKQKTIITMETFMDILTQGKIDDILEFIKNKNILNHNLFNFNDIYWLLKNKDYFYKLVKIFKEKGVFDYNVWSYSIFHNDMDLFVEFMSSDLSSSQFKKLFQHLNNKILQIDSFQIKEYYPLVNPRAHSVGNKKNNILNDAFKTTYKNYLNYLFEKGNLNPEDKLLMTNYLILQDRMKEATQYFEKINQEEITKLETRIQFDYLSAYIDFLLGYPDFKKAKEVCKEYLSYPVLTWRNLFVEIANQLAEFEEKELIEKILKDEKEDKKNQDKAKSQPTFKCNLEKNKINIFSENLNQLEIKCYKIDLEVNFSINPFKKSEIKEFTMVKPFYQEMFNIDQSQKTNIYEIPENIQKENLYIEVCSLQKSLGLSQYLEYIPFSLNYHVNEEFGIIKIINEETKKPIPKIYMKCFAQFKNGSVGFYKDGYTDLRGSFDYVSLNSDTLDDIKLFRILITSKEYGSKIIEIKPPVKIGRIEGKAKNIISKNWRQTQKQQTRKNIYQNVFF